MALILSDLIRTMQSYFRIGAIRIKDNSGVVQARNAGDSAFASLAGNTIRVHGSNATNAIVWAAPGGLGGTVTLTLPATAGSANYFLQTDGTGTLSWAPGSANSSNIEFGVFDEATSSPITALNNPPANSSLLEFTFEVKTAASAGNPTVSAGTNADPDLYVLTTDVDLKETGNYVVHVNAELGATPDDVEITITPDGQTFDVEYYISYSVVA